MPENPLISIIIPVWNHAEEAMACLKSIEAQTYRPLEVIMVDDGSSDGLSDRVSDVKLSVPFSFTRLELHRNAQVARNEGFRQSKGAFVIFLDADAELEPNAIERHVQALSEHPEAAFAYASFFFGRKLFKGRPFDAEALKQQNYIHTSALIRRQDFIGFDEAILKFQDWDLWLSMIEKGKSGVWIPEPLMRFKPRRRKAVAMSHWLPKFVYDIPWDVLGFAPWRVRRYRECEQIIRRKHGLINEEKEREVLATKRRTAHWLGLVVGLEVLSALVIFHPTINSVVTVIVGLIALGLTVKRPSYALGLLAMELLIGSKGGLLRINGDENNNGGISLRIVLFAAFVLGWLILLLREKRWPKWRELLRGRACYVGLFGLIVYAVIVGLLRGERSTVVSDANAWMTWLALIPVLDLVSTRPDAVRRDVWPAIMAGLLWLPVKTLLLFYFFSHGFLSVATPVYLWVRRTGVGEVTLVALNAFRIFFQSHIYAAFVIVSIFAWSLFRRERLAWMRGLLILSIAEILISLSRSFWMGIAAGLLIVFVLVWKRSDVSSVRAIRGLVTAGLSALVLVAFTLALPIPPVNTSSLFHLLESRTNMGESAAVSRWTLLRALKKKIAEHPVLGSGFGATVTYESKDPRIIAQSGGIYTTYAFEWGWLEHWIKFGILGIPVIFWILFSLGLRFWRSDAEVWMRVAAVGILATLAVIHVFTPYLNHPLGFLVIFVGEGMILIPPPDKGD